MIDPNKFDPSDGFDPLDADLQAAARAYHRPPSVPADAMWEAIRARRASATPTTPDLVGRDLVRAPSVRVDRPDARRDEGVRRTPGSRVDVWGRAARRWTPIAVAAAALLAVGIGLGRYSAEPNGPAAPATIAATRASSEPADPASAARVTPGGAGVAPSLRGPRVAEADRAPRVAATTDAPTRHVLGAQRAVGAPTLVAGAGTMAGAPDARDAASAPLRAAADQHLADTEALLTAFDAASGATSNPPVSAAPDSAWARDLLTTTRLLLDSPAGRDPARRSLLESLELVLVQIARLPHADTPAERALIERALRNGDLMARLRAAVPSGPGRGRADAGRAGVARAVQGT